MPVVQQQMQALRVFRELRDLKSFQTETAAKLDAMLPSILDRAFKGELL
jgi:hypothetical protein